MGRSKPVGRAKKAVFALLAAVALLLSGCEGSPVGSMVEEMTGGVEGLLSPPRFSEEQDAVYAALSAHLSGSMRLCYPQEGENLSAFTLCELDGSPGGEAVVFYEPTSASAASPVQMLFSTRMSFSPKPSGGCCTLCRLLRLPNIARTSCRCFLYCTTNPTGTKELFHQNENFSAQDGAADCTRPPVCGTMEAKGGQHHAGSGDCGTPAD